MPRKKWIDKNNATTFQLLYRPQNDPLLHDESVSDRALYQVSGASATSGARDQSKGLHIADLEDDVDFESMRENEGEAASYGVYFDDTNYDYMQHLHEIGEGSGEAHFIDAMPVKVQGKGKGKGKMMKLEDVLREASLDGDDETSRSGVGSVLDDNLSTFSRSTRSKTYQDQQDIPDAIAGFQPDMDPRLREVLEALDDEAYVDDKDEDGVFGALTQGGQNAEVDLSEFEAAFEDDEGWESDVTEKVSTQMKEVQLPICEDLANPSSDADSNDLSQPNAAAASAEDGDWLRDFAKFKRDNPQKPAPRTALSAAAPSDLQAPATTLYTLGGTPLRQKRRKGALTNPSAYSMTSSSLVRTEGQQLLDARFERFEAMYTLDEGAEFGDQDGNMSIASGMSKQSRVSTISTVSFADGSARSDFDGMMDGFLDGWHKGHPGGGKKKGAKGKRGKNGNEVLGMRMLDEIRGELGPAKLRSQKAS